MISTMETIGKPLVSICTGKQLGIVCNIEIKKQKVARLVVLGDEIDSLDYIFVPVQNIYSFGSQVVTIKSHTKIEQSSLNTCPKILGSTAINQQGEKSFDVQDVVFDEKSFNVLHFTAQDNVTHDASLIATIEDDYIILKGKIKPVAKPRAKKTLASALQHEPKLIINEHIIMSSEEPIEKKASLQTPSKIICDYSFLIGRTITDNLISKAGKVIILSGEKLNSKNLSAAIKDDNLNFVLKNNQPAF